MRLRERPRRGGIAPAYRLVECVMLVATGLAAAGGGPGGGSREAHAAPDIVHLPRQQRIASRDRDQPVEAFVQQLEFARIVAGVLPVHRREQAGKLVERRRIGALGRKLCGETLDRRAQFVDRAQLVTADLANEDAPVGDADRETVIHQPRERFAQWRATDLIGGREILFDQLLSGAEPAGNDVALELLGDPAGQRDIPWPSRGSAVSISGG